MAAKKIKTGLGRGIESLLSDTLSDKLSTESDGSQKVDEIDIHLIKPNPNQPRKTFDKDNLNELAESIKEHGIIQPIILNDVDNGYQIVAGERRWRAAGIAGLKKVPCIVRDLSEEELALFAIVENMQREDLNPVEEAEGLERMLQTFGLTQEQVSKSVGKSRPYITNSIRLLKLEDEVKELLRSGKISSGHGRTLLAVEGSQQIELANRVIDKKMSVRELEALVAGLNNPNTTIKKTVKDPDVAQVEQSLKMILGTKVNIKGRKKKGKIEIEYYSREELDRLIDLLGGLKN